MHRGDRFAPLARSAGGASTKGDMARIKVMILMPALLLLLIILIIMIIMIIMIMVIMILLAIIIVML